jgi:hypothetical protein
MFAWLSDQQVVKVEGLRRNVAQFFSLAITREVLEKMKVLQNDEFVASLESRRNWKLRHPIILTFILTLRF